MKTPRLALAMGYIDDDLISGAVEYKRPSAKSAWFRYVATAACLCLIVSGGIRMITGLLPNSSAPVYGVLAEVTKVLEDGRYEVKITGTDQNFAQGDIVTVNYDCAGKNSEECSLKPRDIIAITYSEFEKTQMIYEITAGQIEIVTATSDKSR